MTRIVLPVKEGDTWNIAIKCRDSDGDPFDFSGFTVHMEIRNAPRGAVLRTLTSASGDIAIDDPIPGDLLVTVDSDATSGIVAKNFNVILYSDVELRDSNDPPLVITVASLELDVEPDSTIRV